MEISLAAAGNFTLACPGGADPSIQDLNSSTVKVTALFYGRVLPSTAGRGVSARTLHSSAPQRDSLLTTTPFPASQVTIFVGIDAATQVPYGAGGSLDIPANATKVNVETANWWAGGGCAGAAPDLHTWPSLRCIRLPARVLFCGWGTDTGGCCCRPRIGPSAARPTASTSRWR